MSTSSMVSGTAEAEVAATVDRIVRERLVTPVFQPIVELASGAVVGAEALARGPAGTPLESPDALFDAARRAGRLGEIDMLCAERALESALAASVPLPLLFVNAEPAVLDQPLSPRLLEMLLGGLPFRMVLEYTERALSTVPAALLRIAGQVQMLGNGLALDDVGADPMSLAFLPFIQPEVIKLDMHLLRTPAAPATAEVCAVVAATARRTGAVVIAEGIETEQDIATARTLGASWGQGWHFGRPAPLSQLPPASLDRPTLRPPCPGLHQPLGTPFDIASAHAPVHAATWDSVAAMVDEMCRAAQRGRHTVILGAYGDVPELASWRPRADEAARHAAYASVSGPDLFAGQSCLVVVTAGYTAALCQRTSTRHDGPETVLTHDRAVVESIGRVLLHRLDPAR